MYTETIERQMYIYNVADTNCITSKGGFTLSVMTVDVSKTHFSSSHFGMKIALFCSLHHVQAMKSVEASQGLYETVNHRHTLCAVMEGGL